MAIVASINCRMRILAPLVALALFGCDEAHSRQVSLCEARVKSRLVSPSTYKRADVTEWVDREDPTRYVVYITYDAGNYYGAIVRERHACDFPATDGKIDWQTYDSRFS